MKMKNKLLILLIMVFAVISGGCGQVNDYESVKSSPVMRVKETQTEINDTQELLQAEEKEYEKPSPIKEESVEYQDEDIPENEREYAEKPVKEEADYDADIEIKDEPVKDEYMTEPIPSGKPIPVEPETVKVSKQEKTCTLSVRCDTILKNISHFDEEKIELLLQDGVIFPEQRVVFYEGESVFNLLSREMKKNKIHLEFVSTPIYNSAYIEGIGNLYEYDCGELSGWMYKVNDWFPNYGSSRYQLQDGDNVQWIYTCDLGRDIGGEYSARNGKTDE